MIQEEVTGEGMVTLRSIKEEDMDSDGQSMPNYVPDDSDESTEEVNCGAPRAILTCRKNSHPFQERVLNLYQPVKIGRTVARTRAAPNNGFFDCKVLSRNHALMWYENEKFYIQDTKSSNGTFVNSQRLSRGAEDSLPREIWSGDTLQFGVDVLENQRKVTHGCIVATLKLIYPNGKEAKPCPASDNQNSTVSYPQEEIFKLQLILFEAQQREERLHGKLEELHSIISFLQESCHDSLNVRFEETRLLSKIENHEKRSKVLNKLKAASIESSEVEVVNQLLADVEKVQTVSQEIQERLHRQLMESEDSLTAAKINASNLELEVESLRDLATRSENSVQEIAAKCTNYVKTIESLETRLSSQMKSNVELDSKMNRSWESEMKNYSEPKDVGSENFINEEWLDSLPPKLEKDFRTNFLDWYDKCYPLLKDRINEDDEWKGKCLLDATLAYLQQTKNDCEKLQAQKELLQLRLSDDELIKTELRSSIENLGPVTNETVTRLEADLKEVEAALVEKQLEKKIVESRYSRLKIELDPVLSLCIDKDEPEIVSSLTTEKKDDETYEKLILSRDTESEKESQIVTSDSEEKKDTEPVVELSETPSKASMAITDGAVTIRRTRSKQLKPLVAETLANIEVETETKEAEIETKEKRDEDEKSAVKEDDVDSVINEKEVVDDDSLASTSESIESSVKVASRRLDVLLKTAEDNPQSVNMCNNIRRIQDICDQVLEEVPRTAENLRNIQDLLNLVSEDLVNLLVREQQMFSEQKRLEEKLNASLSQADVAALSLADRFLAVVIGLVICYIGSRFLEYLGVDP